VQTQERVKIDALDAGADDYLTKPFSVGELKARLRVAMRNARKEEPELVFVSGKLRVDLTTRTVTSDTKEIKLTPTEYDLLRVLIRYAGRVLTHQQLLKEIRVTSYQVGTHLLRSHMSNLRRKIEQNPSNPEHILTESGVGYRLKVNI
jgi:two-component system KDP operon response regulator KdpE